MNRRHFLNLLTSAGLAPQMARSSTHESADIYKLSKFGNTRLLHFTDCHAQLLPIYYREPQINLGIGNRKNQPPHLTGIELLNFFGLQKHSRHAHAFSSVDFVKLAQEYGKMGGFAHLDTLIQQLRNESGENNSLLLDGGDSWQGSATALWTQGQDMVQACNLLGVDVMTGHWEFTYGKQQLLNNLQQFKGDFVAQNIRLSDEAQFNQDIETEQIFPAYVIKTLNNAKVAIIGQAFPYTPIANPRRFVTDWQFGIQETQLQQLVNKIQQQKQADVIVLLSHNGLSVDLKLAARITGLDIILGGHTHDALPQPLIINNSSGKTWVTNAGSHGKFLAVLDLDIRQQRLHAIRYQLLPVFANLLPASKPMQTLIDTIQQPFLKQLRMPLTTTTELLYRRDTFMGSFDRLLLQSLLEVNQAEIAFSAGFRWGASVLPAQTLYFEDLMHHTAISYPNTYTTSLSGMQIKAILEDVADNLFNPDPYYRQGGDMVRAAGFSYNCHAEANYGQRIHNLRLNSGKLMQAQTMYTVAGWAQVNTIATGQPIWETVTDFLSLTKNL